MQLARPHLRLVGTAVMILLILSCGGNGDGGRNGGHVSLSSANAIEFVQRHVSAGGGTVMALRVPYKESKRTRTARCTEQDTDFESRCNTPSPPAAPYGYKWETVRTTQYRSETVRLPAGARWTADYSRSTDSWHVNSKFRIKDIQQVISWIVDDDTGRVSER